MSQRSHTVLLEDSSPSVSFNTSHLLNWLINDHRTLYQGHYIYVWSLQPITLHFTHYWAFLPNVWWRTVMKDCDEGLLLGCAPHSHWAVWLLSSRGKCPTETGALCKSTPELSAFTWNIPNFLHSWAQHRTPALTGVYLNFPFNQQVY